jgi:hypothetical protein
MGETGPARVPEYMVMASFFRSPLGILVAVLVVGLAVIALGMKAFGGTPGDTFGGLPPPPTPLSRAQFKRAGQRICLSLRPQLRWLANNKPRKLRQLPNYIARDTSIVDRLTAELDRLVPPPSAAASFRHLRRNLGVVDRAMHRLNHLTQTHQWRRGYLLVHSRWWKKMEKRLGPYRPLKDIRCGQASHTSA